MNAEELEHLFNLKAVYVKRLRIRELQIAQSGLLCPPELIIDAEELRSTISQIDDKILQGNESQLQSSSSLREDNRFTTVRSLIQEKFEEILHDLDNVVYVREAVSSETKSNETEYDTKQDIFDIATTPKKSARNARSIIEHITAQLGYTQEEILSDHISYALSKNVQQNDYPVEIIIHADFDREENFGVLTMDIPDDIIKGKDISFVYSLILRINSLLGIGSFAVDVDSEQITFRGIIPTGYVDMEFVSLMVTGFEKVNMALFPFIEKYADKNIIRQLLVNKELTDNSKTLPI
jgi:hypothetical protein